MSCEPIRTCVGCRKPDSVYHLVRYVSSGGILTIDARRRLPGRGAWVHACESCWNTAMKKNAFARALRVSKLDVPDVGIAPITESG